MQPSIPFMRLRGGSSRGVAIRAADLPEHEPVRDQAPRVRAGPKAPNGDARALWA